MIRFSLAHIEIHAAVAVFELWSPDVDLLLFSRMCSVHDKKILRNVHAHKPLNNVTSRRAWKNLQVNGTYITTLTLHQHPDGLHKQHA
jgi:hypothetical protein